MASVTRLGRNRFGDTTVQMVMQEPSIAFAAPTLAQPGLQVLVNFGVFAGRAATPAEIDRLAEWLLDEVGEVSIISEERHEIDGQVEASVHQVRIQVARDRVPQDAAELEQLEEKIVERADYWARTCIAERHSEILEFGDPSMPETSTTGKRGRALLGTGSGEPGHDQPATDRSNQLAASGIVADDDRGTGEERFEWHQSEDLVLGHIGDDVGVGQRLESLAAGQESREHDTKAEAQAFHERLGIAQRTHVVARDHQIKDAIVPEVANRHRRRPNE